MRYFLDSDENSNYYVIPVYLKEEWLNDLVGAINSTEKEAELEDNYSNYKVDINVLTDLTFTKPIVNGVSVDDKSFLKIFLYLLVTNYMTLTEVNTLMEHTKDFINAKVTKTFPFADIFVERLYEKLKE